ncbi:Myosin-binding protein 3 [Abeliophyllum distichum]|uniref:Myosin-binding protein 3 n=1 Tax=Abeliophyllum distichum TaxID=126358 RepID=A0ABD1R9D1_9LAMI
MTVNRFATILKRNTSKITLILIDALLEWILIVLLLFNSLFSYLIIKFAEYFGLKPPCICCTRLDHIFEPAKNNKNIHINLFCEIHAREISKLGFCSNHQKLSEFAEMCEDCLSSGPEFTLHPGIKELAMIQGDKGKGSLNCSCCGVRLCDNIYSSCIMLKNFWDVLECAHKRNLIAETGDDDDIKELCDFDKKRSDFATDSFDDDQSFQNKCENQMVSELVQVELTNSMAEEEKGKNNVKDEYHDNSQEFNLDSENRETKAKLVGENVALDVDKNEEIKFSVLDSMEMEVDKNSPVFRAKEWHLVTGEFAEETIFSVDQIPSQNAGDVQAMAFIVSEEVARISNGETETEAEVLIGTDIPDLDITDEIQNDDPITLYEYPCEDSLTSFASFNKADDHGPMRIQFEEDPTPSTHISMDSLHNLHEKLVMLETKDSRTKESLDGSVTSELEGGDGLVTVERLKSELRAEQKALQTLYSELEEEQRASAVAANQTMAMIDRLQEEKAAMQIEALHYQGMMEEQSEYNPEALQLLNELMVKREKEKQELERELEGVRKKLLDYEDSDGLSVDLNQEVKEEEGFDSNQECNSPKTPANEESLAEFEEERLSILVQLKVLEEKLVSLDYEEERPFEDSKPVEDLHKENGIRVDENTCYSDESNEHLLQEILQHLHDLRNVELLEKNLSDGAII